MNWVRLMDAYPCEWVCVSPGGNAGKTACHTWNKRTASPLHTHRAYNYQLFSLLRKNWKSQNVLCGKQIQITDTVMPQRATAYLILWNIEIKLMLNINDSSWAILVLYWRISFGEYWAGGTDLEKQVVWKLTYPQCTLLKQWKTKNLVWKSAMQRLALCRDIRSLIFMLHNKLRT